MNQQQILLASLHGSYSFSPVQVQKLLFLIDKNLSPAVGGPFFEFRPYDYGPFDKNVYLELEKLSSQGLVGITYGNSASQRWYSLTPEGDREASCIINTLDENHQNYMRSLSDFVRRLSFRDLVSAIYKAYPETKVNSVFAEQ